ncbi:MAG: YbjN domain-containing protein [Bacteroidia bacterium]|nr:YbjN domain-containing protein [Bacteroidia bacterium]
MQDLTYHYTIVENALRQLGVDPTTCRGDQPGSWNLVKGSAKIMLDLWYIEQEKRAYFSGIAPVMKFPKSNSESLAVELLSLNHQLYGAAFTLFKDIVYIRTIREVDGMDTNEVSAMILRVANYADHYDDILQEKFPYMEKMGF